MNNNIPKPPQKSIVNNNKLEAPPIPVPQSSIKNDNNSEIVLNTEVQKEQTKPKQSSKKIVGVIIGIVIFLILLITFGVMGYYFFNNDKNVINDSEWQAEVDVEMNDDVQLADNNLNNQVKKIGFNSSACKKVMSMSVELGSTEEEVKDEIQEMQEEFDEVANQDKYNNVDISIEDICVITLFSIDKEVKQVFEEMAMNEPVVADVNDARIIKLVDNFLKKNDIEVVTVEKLLLMMMLSLDSAKEVAQEASVKSSIASTVPAMILCMDDDGYLMEPVEGGEICRDDTKLGTWLWPTISDDGGVWGGCEMQVSREDGIVEGFEYCAILPDGVVVHCSETGCIFDNDLEGSEIDNTITQGSYVDDLLMQDTMNGIVAKVATLGCTQQFDSIDKSVTEDYASSNNVRTWKEQWIVQGCENNYPIDITFIETMGQGTTWTIK